MCRRFAYLKGIGSRAASLFGIGMGAVTVGEAWKDADAHGVNPCNGANALLGGVAIFAGVLGFGAGPTVSGSAKLANPFPTITALGDTLAWSRQGVMELTVTFAASDTNAASITAGLGTILRMTSGGGSNADPNELVDLFHGSRKGIKGGKFSLEDAIANQEDTHLTDKENPGIFFTDDPERAAQAYRGTEMARVRVPRWLALEVRQIDRATKLPEYVFRKPEHIAILNEHIEIKSYLDALKDWIFGAERKNFKKA